MTISVTASRKFVGDAPVSVRAWAKLEQRTPPISLRDLATVERRDVNGKISAGDVECSYQVTLWNSGRWFITADFSDHGTFFGDFFTFQLEIAGQDRGIHLDRREEPLGAGDTLRMNDNGLDPWIRENWPTVRDGRISEHLSASPDITGIIEAVTGIVVFAAVLGFFASPGKTNAVPCPDQGDFDHNQCIRFFKSENDPQTPVLTG